MAFLRKLSLLLLTAALVASEDSTDELFRAAEDEEPAPKTVEYNTPSAPESAYLFETFDGGLPDGFVKTSGTKQDEDGNKYAGTIVAEAALKNALDGDLGLVLKDKASHHAIASKLSKPFVFTDEETFVAQYEVNFQDGIDCGGAYIKLFSQDDSLDLANFHDKTRFTFMFGPDKCSGDYKLHFIYNYQNPKTGEFEEKHMNKKPTASVIKAAYTDAASHLYKLVVKKDNSFSVSVDNKVLVAGNLLEDMSPAINPEKEIVDDEDSKPEDWDDRKEIVDETDAKPDDWDESEPKQIKDEGAVMPKDWREDLEILVDDPEAIMPEDWDEEMDGEYTAPQIDNPACKGISGCGSWEAPMKANPKYKGKWAAKKIKNPNYQGVWKARMIANPNYFEDAAPFSSASPIAAMAIEVWTMSKDIYFDNFYLGSSEIDAGTIAAATFTKKQEQVKLNAPSIMEKAKKAANDNKWIMYVVTALVGIPVLYLLYSKTRSPSPEVPAEQPEREGMAETDEEEVHEKPSKPEADSGAGDHALPDTEEDTGAGDASSEQEGEEESSSEEESIAEKKPEAKRRSNRRKAD